ncbi:hypothetical protein JEY40_33050 [Bradyrhizobium japonicum]|uniref:hypothetical protein n=1 Tax=Bradyrhizobium japonicum TaxID=375 RepID=UPI00200C6A61|nr:hypothetical protein [Bradyrhizobium japonicum]UQD70720.1 hypothetical protein JEY40_33050 [Bradyrhizobium japonicum]
MSWRKVEPIIAAFILSAISALCPVVAVCFPGDISSHFNAAMTLAFRLALRHGAGDVRGDYGDSALN